MIEMKSLMLDLLKVRPIFHSEADFQHALAWEIHKKLPKSLIRLEYKPSFVDSRMYYDIWCTMGERSLAIELKYKTRGLNLKSGEENFDLLNHSAQDISRYDFLKDVHRLERALFAGKDVSGYAIMLTNDSAYWKPSRDENSIDAAFRIHEGRKLSGELSWSSMASKGTTKGRTEPILLRNTYSVYWQDYSEFNIKGYGKFKFLIINVGGAHTA